jgi:hypothetical protein
MPNLDRIRIREGEKGPQIQKNKEKKNQVLKLDIFSKGWRLIQELKSRFWRSRKKFFAIVFHKLKTFVQLSIFKILVSNSGSGI